MAARTMFSRALVSGACSTSARRATATALSARTLATYASKGLPMPVVAADDVVVRTPFVSDTAQIGDVLGQVEELLVAPGDAVVVDQTIAVIDTDKAAIDIRTPVAGIVSQVLVAVNENVFELHPVATIGGASSPRVRMKKE